MKPALHSCIAAILVASYVAFAQTDQCKEETTKAETFYEMCAKFDKESTGYIECLNMFMEQKAKAKKVCEKVATPAVSEECLEERDVAKAIYDSCMNMDVETEDYAECSEDYENQNIRVKQACQAKLVPVKPKAAVAAAPKPMPLSQALSGSGLSSVCVEGFAKILNRDGFNMSNFAKDLVISVAKVKLQLKSPLPFGKPKDNDGTSVGLTVGCIKSLPESPAEIQSLLKNIALKAGLNFAASAMADDDDDYNIDLSIFKKKVRFGIRTGFNINDFRFGYTDFDREIGIGFGYGAGLMLNIPLASILRLNMESDFYYRLLYGGNHNITEGIVSIPVLFQIGKSFYFATGAQMDIPIWTNVKVLNGSYFENNRSSVDFGLVAGLGYMAENVGFDFKFVYGLTRLFEDFTIDSHRSYEDRSSLRQYGLGVSYFF
jgi:hypothetical protein